MNLEMEKLQPIAIQAILNDFNHDGLKEKGIVVIYATKPYVHLIEVLSLMSIPELMRYSNYKYNAIPIITMRISQIEYDYYLRELE